MNPPHLRALLKRVSRSFYLSVRVLPGAVQSQVGLGYLLARAADTIADTALLPAAERVALLGLLRTATTEASSDGRARRAIADSLHRLPDSAAMSASGETELLSLLPECLDCLDALSVADRRRVEWVLDQLILGMERDLARFPAAQESTQTVAPSQVVALRDDAELDAYTYLAAGCVGEFWTELMAAHFADLRPLAEPELRRRGVALGKALQLVNVIRDVAADLRIGRCYWPASLLAAHELTATRLGELVTATATPSEAAAIAAVTATLLGRARALCATAWPYVQAIPATAVRLRLACTWPLLLAVDTLAAVESAPLPLLGSGTSPTVKIGRNRVYRRLLASTGAALRDLPHGRRGGGHLDRIFQPPATH